MFAVCLARPQNCATVPVEQVSEDDVPTVNFAGSAKLRTPHLPYKVELATTCKPKQRRTKNQIARTVVDKVYSADRQLRVRRW